LKLNRTYVMPALTVVASLGLCAVAPAFAESAPALPATTSSTAFAGPILGSEAKRIKQQEQAQQARREASYHAWFFRKYGYYPTAAQFRAWHYRSYGVYPS
jgi:hypothetical protein